MFDQTDDNYKNRDRKRKLETDIETNGFFFLTFHNTTEIIQTKCRLLS